MTSAERSAHDRRFDAIIFDLGSTLIYFTGDWPEVSTQANAELLRHLQSAGLALDEADFLKEFKARLQDYYSERETEFIEYTTAYILRTLLAERGYPQAPEDLIVSALEALYRVSQAYWQAEVDTLSTLEWLRQEDYRLAIISNAGDDPDVQALIDKAGIRNYFEFILTSAAAGIRKPNPRIFEMALERLGVRPERAAMVGDTLGADILGAHNAGLYAIWITRRANSPANLAHADTIRPDALIETLSELPELLQRLAVENH